MEKGWLDLKTIVSGLLLIAVIVGPIVTFVRWRHAVSSEHWTSCGFLAVAVLWFLWHDLQELCVGIQLRCSEKFEAARTRGLQTFHLGGKRWVEVGGAFFHIGNDGRGRGVTYDGETSRELRFGYEIAFNEKRRRCFFGCLIGISGCAATMYDAESAPMGRVIIVVLLLWAIWLLGWEILYRLGVQIIPGAMVLDPPARGFDARAVNAQMAHGAARLATEREASLAASGRRRQTLDDRRF
jgi:hypothetical protein